MRQAHLWPVEGEMGLSEAEAPTESPKNEVRGFRGKSLKFMFVIGRKGYKLVSS
jgi:hypothetical protein